MPLVIRTRPHRQQVQAILQPKVRGDGCRGDGLSRQVLCGRIVETGCENFSSDCSRAAVIAGLSFVAALLHVLPLRLCARKIRTLAPLFAIRTRRGSRALAIAHCALITALLHILAGALLCTTYVFAVASTRALRIRLQNEVRRFNAIPMFLLPHFGR